MSSGTRLPLCVPILSALVSSGCAQEDFVDFSVLAPECAPDAPYFAGADLQGPPLPVSSFEALGALPLCRSDSSEDVLRILWLPSFHPPGVVTVHFEAQGGSLVGRVLVEAAGSANNRIRETTASLDSAALTELMEILREADLSGLPTDPGPSDWVCMDGADIVLEQLVAGRYHVVSRHACEMEDGDGLVDLAKFLLTESGIASQEVFASYFGPF